MFYFGKRSRKKLVGVHPHLIHVLEDALQITPTDFGVSRGVGTVEEQREYVESGASKTMNSKHLIQFDGWSHAVDIFVLVEGKVNWEHKHFRKVIQSIFTAAIDRKVQIEVGALWRDHHDSPHIQLNGKYYGRP